MISLAEVVHSLGGEVTPGARMRCPSCGGVAALEVAADGASVGCVRCAPDQVITGLELHLFEVFGREPLGVAALVGDRAADITPPVGSLPAFPAHYLPEPLGPFVRALAEALQVPGDLPATLVLAAVAVTVQRRWVVEVRPGYSEPLSLFVAAVLGSGERKSACIAAVTQPLLAWEEAEQKRLQPAVEANRSRRVVLEKRCAHLADAAAKEKVPDRRRGFEVEADDAALELAKLPRLVYPRLVADDVTAEGLAALLAAQGERMGVFSAEGGLFETLAGRYSSGVPNLDVVLKGHAGDFVRVDRKVGEPLRLGRPALTLGIAVQPEVLRDLAAKPGFRGRGLTPRFMFALPESRVGFRDADAPPVPANLSAAYGATLRRLLESEAEESEPRVLALDAEARELFRALQDRVEVRMRPHGTLAHVKDWAGKAPGLAARLAGLLALVQARDSVDAATMAAAARIVEGWALPHALAAFAAMDGAAEHDELEAVLACVRSMGDGAVSVRDVHARLKGQRRFRETAAVQRALEALAAAGHLEELPPEAWSGVGRKPGPRWRLRRASTDAQNPQNREAWARDGNSVDFGDVWMGASPC